MANIIASSSSKPSLRRDTHMQSYTIIARIPHNPSPPLPTPTQLPALTDSLSFLSFIFAWERGVGIFDRFSGNDTHTVFSPPFHPLNLSFSPLHRRRFLNACIATPSVFFFCSAALPRCCTSSHTITTPHSGLSSSIKIPLSHPFFPFTTHFIVSPISFHPDSPHSPCDMVIWFAMCLCFHALFFHIPPTTCLYAFRFSLLCLFCSLSDVFLSSTITTLSLLSFL
jgi:hypothetical protein